MGKPRSDHISQAGGWTAWGDRLLAALSLLLVAALAGAWIMQYANPEGNAGLIDRLSYTAVDPTWMPPGVTTPYPLIGVHYFGDMWYHIGFGEAQSPYIISGRPAQYPPLAILVFKAWGIFGYPIALAVMTFLNVALVSIFAWRITAPSPRSRRIMIIALTILLTTPMIVTLDRGGHQYIALGCLAWALYLYRRGNTAWALIPMILAISLKTYFAFFLVYPFVRGHKRFALESAALAGMVNVLLFLVFPGRPTVSFGGFFTSSAQFSNAVGFDNIFNGSSLTSAFFGISKLLEGVPSATDRFYSVEPYLSVPGLLWLLLVAVVAASRKVPYWASITLVLSTSAMAIPAAWAYNFASASLAGLYFGTRGIDPFPIQRRTFLDRWSFLGSPGTAGRRSKALLRFAIGASIAIALTPQFLMLTGQSGASVRSYFLIAPLTTLVAGLFTFLWMVLKRSQSISPST